MLREGLRNVVKHANASRATLIAAVEGDEATVTVVDDGSGPPPGLVATGHLGLRLLEDTLTDVGGSLRLARRAEGGIELVARFPTSFASELQLR